jgi:hypothetical protein
MLPVCHTGHGQSGLKDLDASLGCYHPKRTKVYGPTVRITSGDPPGKCSAESKLKKRVERLGCYCPKRTNSHVNYLALTKGKCNTEPQLKDRECNALTQRYLLGIYFASLREKGLLVIDPVAPSE